MFLSVRTIQKLSTWIKKADIFGEYCDMYYGFDFIDQFMRDHGLLETTSTIQTLVVRGMLDAGVGHAARMHIRHCLRMLLDVYEMNQLFELKDINRS